MPRADDADGDVTGRVGDSDAVPLVSGLVESELDTDLVPVCDTAPDAVHGTRSFQQSFTGPQANPNADATASSYTDPAATTSANPHTYAAATTTTKPHANAGTVALPRLKLFSR